MNGKEEDTRIMEAPEAPKRGNKRPLDGMNWETIRKSLIGKDMKDALKAGTELKERIEIGPSQEVSNILTTLVPTFSSVLTSITRPNPDPFSDENCLRKVVLEAVSRIPKDDTMRPHAHALLDVCMDVLAKDYEDNALLASKIIFDLHKNFRSMPQDQVQPYLDFVQQVYRSLPTSVEKNFHFPSGAAATSNTLSVTENPLSVKDSSNSLDKDLLSILPGDKIDLSQRGSPSSGLQSSPIPKVAVKSTSSFRVLTECPLTVMLLFQLYPKFLKTNIPTLIQLMMEALAIRSPPLQSLVKSKIETYHKRLYYNRSRELVAAQVKTLSFLTYLLRGFADQMKPYEDRIATNVVSLMTSCPRESIGTRKELMVATRHILATDFRKGFFRHVDSLLDERILMGSHRHSDQTVIRPLGYSTVADLVLHVRSMLTLKQLSKVVFMFSRVLHDSSMKLPVSIQLTAVRLLLNVVDIIYNNKDPNPQIGRDLLDRILDTLVNKLGTLKDSVDSVRQGALHEMRREGAQSQYRMSTDSTENPTGNTFGAHKDHGSDKREEASRNLRVLDKANIIDADEWLVEGTSSFDVIRDMQSMIRSIIAGLKTVVWCITNYRIPKDKEKPPSGAADEAAEHVVRMSKFERDLVDKYIEFAIPCIQIFTPLPLIPGDAGISPAIASEQQERDVITYFASFFALLDSFSLRRTLGAKIGLLVDTLIQSPNAMLFPRHLLGSNPRTSFEFCEILLAYLVDHIDLLTVSVPSGLVFLSPHPDVDNSEVENKNTETGRKLILEMEVMPSAAVEAREKTASTHLELFERIIKSLAAFPENERALRPYLQKIVFSALHLSMEKGRGWPDNYCSLLRSVFRSISAGKFEDSYKELLPMIPMVLNGFYRIFQATDDEPLQNYVVEMCLTIPARLSSLLPHMPLLLRMIIASLNASEGDLVNLGLRTLEFWIDNLNPEFLHPILSRQTIICTNLMTALTTHLRPVPYAYGPLALRILGKLGGKNRRFLRNEIALHSASNQTTYAELSIGLQWSGVKSAVLPGLLSNEGCKEGYDSESPRSVPIVLPLESAVKLLATVAKIDLETLRDEAKPERDDDAEFGVVLQRLSRKDVTVLWTNVADFIDLQAYGCDVVHDTVCDEATSALCVICTSLASLLDLDNRPPDLAMIDPPSPASEPTMQQSRSRSSNSSVATSQRSECLKAIVKGLLYGLSVECIQRDSRICAKGLLHYLIGVLTSFQDHVIKIDANGSRLFNKGVTNDVVPPPSKVDSSNVDTTESKPEPAKLASLPEELGSLRPFGYFEVTAPLDMLNPFVVCEAVAEMLSEPTAKIQSNAVQFFKEVLRESIDSSRSGSVRIDVKELNAAQSAFYETLLEALCRFAATKAWNVLSGLRSAILAMIDVLGSSWAMQYEMELVHTAVLSLKRSGREIPFAAVKAFQFFVSIFLSLYGKPARWDSRTCVPDILAIDKENEITFRGDSDEFTVPSDAVLHILIVELASTKQILRFATRYALKCHVFDVLDLREREKKVSSLMPTIKRVLFTRSLRLLPLPEQVAVIEALSTLVDFVPRLFPIADQHLLAFLSEYLKLSSIADGDITDPSIVGFVVDKNGFTGATSASRYSRGARHMSGLFLRRECVVRLCSDVFISIPEELPLGVQLRVSALRLVNTVICRHSDGFFNADATTTPIGNIRPHVINLLFRSLVSDPPMSVRAAHIALQDVLALSVVTKDDGEGTKSQSRLPKELLQTCIRPVLLNLRDYTRLSVSLLRGLARLLSLLASWFNKTLGEKLLEHLQKWTEPELIMACKIWKYGEEPIVAARILDLFALLPHASHFVEPLVKTVIKLEAALHRFKGHQDRSPYRRPLASYLNKHCQYAVSFFFQRLKSPMYNELFQDIVEMKESDPLRSYLSGRQCCVKILNVCFERPLAIIRSEKTSASSTPGKPSPGVSNSSNDIMSTHGITLDQGKQREVSLRQDIEAKQKKLLVLQQEAARAKESLGARIATPSTASEGQDVTDDAKRRHRVAQAAVDKLQKELTERKQRYAAEVAHPETPDSSSKKMTVDALELQNQGFKLVKTLVKYNPTYLTEHNDIVRAFRWLWRSKGRHLRLQHEELMPPRFHRESMLLGSLLVDYSKSFPGDVDVLFEILRIFLQPTTCDFGFIRSFLANTVSHGISNEKKKHLIQLFFALLTGEGPEETKVLCIQLIVMPMLLNFFYWRRQVSLCQEEPLRPAADMVDVGDPLLEDELIDHDTIRKFVQEVLLQNGAPALFGDRARVELLRLSTLFIQSKPELMDAHKNDVIKFSWALLKSDDAICKSWAYLNVCYFIAAFETPAKIILQVYYALIRMHQHDGKGCIKAGLSILLPTLVEKLDEKEFLKLIEYTVRLIYEEGSNEPQLTHIWQTIANHPGVFVAYRAKFLRHMVSSLSRVGLTPSCPIENRFLSITIAELVLQWHNLGPTCLPREDTSGDALPTVPTKKLKAANGRAIDARLAQQTNEEKLSESSYLDQSMVDNVANFLVQMMILLADTKTETSKKDLEGKSSMLLSSILRKWQMCQIHSTCFEKVVSMCAEEVASNKIPMPDASDKKTREKPKVRGPARTISRGSKSVSSKSSQSPGAGREEPKPASTALLCVCLQVFTLLVSISPNNPFFVLNPRMVNEILQVCFLRAKHRDGQEIRKRLKEFLVPFLIAGQNKQICLPEIDLRVRVLLENGIMNSESESQHSLQGPDNTRKSEGMSTSLDDGRVCSLWLASFSLDIIFEVSKVFLSFVESFTGSLVTLAEQLVSVHLQETRSGQHATGTAYRQQHPTAVCGILDEAATASRRRKNSSNETKLGSTADPGLKNITELSTSLRCIIACVRLVSLTDVPYCFGKTRQIFMQTLGSILDSGDNIQLLLTAVGIIGKWLVSEDGSGPLAFDEKITFLRKMSSLDSRQAPLIEAQSVADFVDSIVLAIADQGELDNAFPVETPASDVTRAVELDGGGLAQCFDSPRIIFHRAVTACMLSAHSSVRRRAISFFCREAGALWEAKADCDVSLPTSAGRSVFDMLWKLLHSDYEAVGGRMWPLIFVEALISGCISKVGAISAGASWVPRPNRSPYIGSTASATQACLGSFFELMVEFKEPTEVTLVSVLCLSHWDQSLMQKLFESLLVSAWSEVASDGARALLIRPIEQLMSRPYYSQNFVNSHAVANSVQAMLRACRKLHPQPAFDSELLVTLGGMYRAMHDVLSILEQECKLLGSGRNSVSQKVWSGICACLQQLGEQNLVLGLTQKLCWQGETSYVLSLDIHGLVAEAITGYSKLVDLAEARGECDVFLPSNFEMDVWENRWAYLQKEMGQLKVVAEFASMSGDHGMLLDAAWKNQDWDKVDALKSSPELNALSERGDPSLKMSEMLSAIMRGKLSEVENLHAQSAQLCLQQWQSLSSLADGSHQHSALLHFFHRLVEFRESGQIMVETTNHSNRRTLPDLQNLLRHRLPNDYDELSDWDDIVTWRTHMFSSITSNFQWSEAGTLSTLHDRPWTVIRMAKTARKQGIREVAMLSLNRISDSSMDVSDAFSKLREQILALYNVESDLERTGGLNLVNTTNLGFFDVSQKSELFRLKAQFLSSLNGRSKANQAYCHAVQICPTYAKAWISWGSLCSSLGRLAEKQQAEQQPDPAWETKENPNAKKVAQYMAQAMGCYLEAVSCDSDESCRIHLPKCLWMLAKDGSAPGVLSQTLESRGSNLPCWVWLPWCPQLLTGLYRNEGKAVKAILTAMAKTYPQALYFPLRAFYLERRDVERSKGSLAGSQQGSVVHSEELMSSLRRAHASLWSSLEAILEELIVKFRPSYEEELLATMTALLERVETQIETSFYSTKDNSEDEEAVVASISKTLGRIGSKFFRETSSEPALNKRDERSRKTEAFRDKYKALFEDDFPTLAAKTEREVKVEASYFLGRLRKWKKMLEEQVSSTPQQLPLVESSQSLAHFCTEAPDLWPMSCDPRAAKELFERERPQDDKQNFSSTSASALAAQTAAVTAAIAVANSAASEGLGGEYGGGSSSIEIPGQYVPNTVSAVDSKPLPELHAKLLRFEPRVHVVCRNDQLIRRIGMVGSDGRRYNFLLQFAIPYWTRTDERTVQLCYLFEKTLRRDVVCCRNFLSVQPSPVIPIAQRLRMTYEKESRVSLDDVFRRRCDQAGCETTVIAEYYRYRVKKLCDMRSNENMSPEEIKQLMTTIHIDVLRDVCETKVDATILLDHIQGNLGSAENLFHFRRSFASHLAINSLMQHTFCVVVRTPSRVVLNETSGQVLSQDFRLSYNNQGFLDSQKVPFRLTPNLRELIGPIMMDGRFIPSLSMAASAIKSNMEDIDSILRLLMRDDIVSWYTSKSMAKSDSKTQELENQLVDRVAKNVAAIQAKFSECSVQREPKGTLNLKTQPVNQRVKDLVSEAYSLEALSTMESSFQPWL